MAFLMKWTETSHLLITEEISSVISICSVFLEYPTSQLIAGYRSFWFEWWMSGLFQMPSISRRRLILVVSFGSVVISDRGSFFSGSRQFILLESGYSLKRRLSSSVEPGSGYRLSQHLSALYLLPNLPALLIDEFALYPLFAMWITNHDEARTRHSPCSFHFLATFMPLNFKFTRERLAHTADVRFTHPWSLYTHCGPPK